MTLADAAWLLIQKNPAEKSTYPNYIENCMKKGIHDHPLKINMEPEITLLETENLHLASKCSFQGCISDIFSIFFSKSTGGRFRFLPFELIDGIWSPQSYVGWIHSRDPPKMFHVRLPNTPSKEHQQTQKDPETWMAFDIFFHLFGIFFGIRWLLLGMIFILALTLRFTRHFRGSFFLRRFVVCWRSAQGGNSFWMTCGGK